MPFVHVLFESKLSAIPIVGAGQFCDAFGCVALDTTVLEDIRDHRTFCATDWNSYFGQPDHNPDRRAEILFQKLASSSVQQHIHDIILEFLQSRFAVTDAREFMTRFRTLEEAERFQFADEFKDVCVSALKSCVDFFVEDEGTVSVRMSTLAQAWFPAINEAGGSCVITASTKGDERSIGDRLDFYLNQLDYAPSADSVMFPQGWRIIVPDAVPAVTDVVRMAATPIYAALLNIPRNDPQRFQNAGFEIEVGGGLFLLHDVHHHGADFEFRYPFQPVDQGFENAPGAVICRRNQLQTVLAAITEGRHVMCSRELMHRALSLSPEAQAFLRNASRPLTFFPESSTLEGWEGVLDRLRIYGRVLAYHEAKDSKKKTNRNFLLLVSHDGSTVYLKPASEMLFDRLLQKWKAVEAITDIDNFTTLFSADWVERIEVCREHYFCFGW
jgi:hypothetical protein